MITMTSDGTKEGTKFTTDGEPLKGCADIMVNITPGSWVSTHSKFFANIGIMGLAVMDEHKSTSKAERTAKQMEDAQHEQG